MSAVCGNKSVFPNGKVLSALADCRYRATDTLLNFAEHGKYGASRRSDTDHSKDELLLARIHLGESVGKVAHALNERVARFER